jgi:hypothetical protein
MRVLMTWPMPVIVGVPRSGTTLLRMMIDAHPLVSIPPETGFLPALAELGPGGDSARAWQIITGFHTWPDFHLDPQTLRASIDRISPCSPADAARVFYRLYAERFGKPRWGDKTPTYGTEIGRIASLLPEARFIHLIRDGRDVMLSVRGLWFRPGDTVEACAEDWMTRLARTRELGAQVPYYLEIRYEALVAHAEKTLREVCGFLELTFDASMLTYHTGAGTRLEEHQARYADDGRLIVSKAERVRNQRFVMEPPRRDRIDRWQSELTQAELNRFDAVAGEWLDRLGYRRSSRVV